MGVSLISWKDKDMSNILRWEWLVYVKFFLVFSFSYDSEDSRDSTDPKQDDQMASYDYISSWQKYQSQKNSDV